MATTLTQKNTLATDATFIAQVKMQIIAESIIRLGADKPSGSSENYRKLISLANNIINNPDFHAALFANAIAANSNLASPVADASVATGVTTAFPIIAGITKYEN